MSGSTISRIADCSCGRRRLGLCLMWQQRCHPSGAGPFLVAITAGRWPSSPFSITPYITIYPYRWVRDTIRRASAADIVAATIGLIVGLIIAALLTLPFSELSFLGLGRILPFVGALLFVAIWARHCRLRGQDLAHLFSGLWTVRQRRAAEREERASEGRDREGRGDSRDLEDVIDGRDRHNESRAKKNGKISDKHSARHQRHHRRAHRRHQRDRLHLGTLVVPRFVLEELQHIADSADSCAAPVAAAAWTFSTACKKRPTIHVEISDADIESIVEVDAKLVKMARQPALPHRH